MSPDRDAVGPSAHSSALTALRDRDLATRLLSLSLSLQRGTISTQLREKPLWDNRALRSIRERRRGSTGARKEMRETVRRFYFFLFLSLSRGKYRVEI